MKIIKIIKHWYKQWKAQKVYKQKIRELKNRDPFNYKNF
jgi:hypothetical protein